MQSLIPPVVLAALAFVVKFLAEKVLSAGKPLDVLTLVLATAVVVVGVLLLWHLLHSDDPSAPAVAVLVVAAMAYPAWQAYPVAREWGWAMLELGEWGPPRIDVVAEPPTIARGQTLTLRALKNGEKAIGSSLSCRWSVDSPAVFPWLGDECEVSAQIPEELVSRGAPSLTLRVKVTVLGKAGNRPEYGSSTTTVTVVYAPVVAIKASPGLELFAGQTVELEALVDGTRPEAGQRCQWRIDGTLMKQGCEWSHKAGDPDSGNDQRKEITVEVVEAGGKIVGRQTRRLRIDAGRRFYTFFVVDTSLRIADQWPVIRPDLLAQLDSIDRNGGNAAMTPFGVSRRNAAGRCYEPKRLFDLTPRNLVAAHSSLSALGVTGAEASLLQALRDAVGSLALHSQEGRPLYLVTITAGLDTCEGGGAAEVARILRDAVRAGNLNDLSLRYRFLDITIALTFRPGEAASWRAWEQLAPADQREVLIVAPDIAILRDALAHLTALQVGPYANKQKACHTLLSIIRGQSLLASERAMNDYCRHILG